MAVGVKMNFGEYSLHDSKKSYRRIFLSSVTSGYSPNRIIFYSDFKLLTGFAKAARMDW